VGEENKQKFSADEILFTAPTNILAPLVAPHDPTYASELSTIEYFGALCVVVETSRPLSGIYWLNVADPGFPFGGIIEHTNLIPPCVYGGRCVTYLSRYFEFGNPLASAPEEEIKREFIAGLKKIYPTLCDDEILKVNCFRTRSAAVVVDLNFSAKVPGYKTPIGNFYLASMPQLYPDERSVNNSIRLASDAVAAMGYKNLAPQGSTLAGVVARGK
jgi:protoporphyrinogen oxidase